MTGPVIAVGVAVVAALAMIIVLVRRHIPAEGLNAWVREAYASVREERRKKREAEPDTAQQRTAPERAANGHVADLWELSESGPAYHQARDLREFVGRHRTDR